MRVIVFYFERSNVTWRAVQSAIEAGLERQNMCQVKNCGLWPQWNVVSKFFKLWKDILLSTPFCILLPWLYNVIKVSWDTWDVRNFFSFFPEEKHLDLAQWRLRGTFLIFLIVKKKIVGETMTLSLCKGDGMLFLSLLKNLSFVY